MDQRGPEALLGDDDARPALVDGRRIDVRHEPEEERLEADRLVDLVNLREAVVIEHERRVGGDELRRVVAEGRRRIAVLHEVTARAGEREAAHEARGLRDAIHAVADSAANESVISRVPELAPDDLDLEARHQVLERVLARVDGEPRDEPIEGGEEHEPLRAERDALALEAEARGAKTRLMEGDSLEHAARLGESLGGGREYTERAFFARCGNLTEPADTRSG